MAKKTGRMGSLLLALLVTFTAGFWSGHLSNDTAGHGERTFLGHDVTREPIVVGVKDDQPGTGFVQHYKSTGFDIALVREMASDNGFKVSFSYIPSETRETALTHLDENHVDLVVSTFSITQDRITNDKIWFVGPYAETQQGFMVRKGSPSVRSPQELKGKLICTWSGTTSEDELRRWGADVDVERDASACVTKLQDGIVDSVSTDQLVLYGFAQQHNDLTVLPNVTIGSPQYYGIAMAQTIDGKSTLQDCKRLEGWLENVYLNRDWDNDFRSNLWIIQQQNYGNYKPNPSDIASQSCTQNLG